MTPTINERNKTVEITPEALKTVTDEQLTAIARLIGADSVAHIVVAAGGFDLPSGYLSFRYDFKDPGNGSSIYGGIGPDGAVST